MQREVQIPEGVQVRLEGEDLVVKGPKGEVRRLFNSPVVRIKISKDNIVLFSDQKKDTKRIRAAVGTWAVHIKNMLTGVTNMWEARLKAVYSHFPIRLTVEGNRLLIHNFLGEKNPRTAKILENVKVDLRKEEIVITGVDIEKVGQTCGNFETATRVTGYDRRVFQDGIYLVQKCSPAGENN